MGLLLLEGVPYPFFWMDIYAHQVIVTICLPCISGGPFMPQWPLTSSHYSTMSWKSTYDGTQWGLVPSSQITYTML